MEMKKFYRKRRVSYKVTPVSLDRIVKKRSYKLSQDAILAKQIAAKVCGLTPYEKKAIDHIKKDDLKKARKFLKGRLGSMSRAEKKLEALMKQAK